MPDVSLTLKVGTAQGCCEAVRESSCDVALTQGILPQTCTDLQVLQPRPFPNLPLPSIKCNGLESCVTQMKRHLGDAGFQDAGRMELNH